MRQTGITISDNVLLALNMQIDEVVSSMRKEYAAELAAWGKDKVISITKGRMFDTSL